MSRRVHGVKRKMAEMPPLVFKTPSQKPIVTRAKRHLLLRQLRSKEPHARDKISRCLLNKPQDVPTSSPGVARGRDAPKKAPDNLARREAKQGVTPEIPKLQARKLRNKRKSAFPQKQVLKSPGLEDNVVENDSDSMSSDAGLLIKSNPGVVSERDLLTSAQVSNHINGDNSSKIYEEPSESTRIKQEPMDDESNGKIILKYSKLKRKAQVVREKIYQRRARLRRVKRCGSPEYSLADFIQHKEESGDVSDGEFTQILECPSPVWWEDPASDEDDNPPKKKSASTTKTANTNSEKLFDSTSTATLNTQDKSKTAPFLATVIPKDPKLMRKFSILDNLLTKIKAQKSNTSDKNTNSIKSNTGVSVPTSSRSLLKDNASFLGSDDMSNPFGIGGKDVSTANAGPICEVTKELQVNSLKESSNIEEEDKKCASGIITVPKNDELDDLDEILCSTRIFKKVWSKKTDLKKYAIKKSLVTLPSDDDVSKMSTRFIKDMVCTPSNDVRLPRNIYLNVKERFQMEHRIPKIKVATTACIFKLQANEPTLPHKTCPSTDVPAVQDKAAINVETVSKTAISFVQEECKTTKPDVNNPSNSADYSVLGKTTSDMAETSSKAAIPLIQEKTTLSMAAIYLKPEQTKPIKVYSGLDSAEIIPNIQPNKKLNATSIECMENDTRSIINVLEDKNIEKATNSPKSDHGQPSETPEKSDYIDLCDKSSDGDLIDLEGEAILRDIEYMELPTDEDCIVVEDDKNSKEPIEILDDQSAISDFLENFDTVVKEYETHVTGKVVGQRQNIVKQSSNKMSNEEIINLDEDENCSINVPDIKFNKRKNECDVECTSKKVKNMEDDNTITAPNNDSKVNDSVRCIDSLDNDKDGNNDELVVINCDTGKNIKGETTELDVNNEITQTETLENKLEPNDSNKSVEEFVFLRPSEKINGKIKKVKKNIENSIYSFDAQGKSNKEQISIEDSQRIRRRIKEHYLNSSNKIKPVQDMSKVHSAAEKEENSNDTISRADGEMLNVNIADSTDLNKNSTKGRSDKDIMQKENETDRIEKNNRGNRSNYDQGVTDVTISCTKSNQDLKNTRTSEIQEKHVSTTADSYQDVPHAKVAESKVENKNNSKSTSDQNKSNLKIVEIKKANCAIEKVISNVKTPEKIDVNKNIRVTKSGQAVSNVNSKEDIIHGTKSQAAKVMLNVKSAESKAEIMSGNKILKITLNKIPENIITIANKVGEIKDSKSIQENTKLNHKVTENQKDKVPRSGGQHEVPYKKTTKTHLESTQALISKEMIENIIGIRNTSEIASDSETLEQIILHGVNPKTEVAPPKEEDTNTCHKHARTVGNGICKHCYPTPSQAIVVDKANVKYCFKCSSIYDSDVCSYCIMPRTDDHERKRKGKKKEASSV